MKRLSAAICVALLLTHASVPSFSAEGDLNRVISWFDGSDNPLNPGSLYKITTEKTPNGTSTKKTPCFTLFDNVQCEDISEGDYSYTTTMMLCQSESQLGCISSLQLETADGKRIVGRDLGEWEKQVDGRAWPMEVLNALPPRRTSNLVGFWVSQTESYTIDVSPRVNYEIRNGLLSESYLELRSMPVFHSPETPIQVGIDNPHPCVLATATSGCFLTYDLPADYRIRISMRTKSSPGGWVNGRVLRPEIEYKPASESLEISVEGGFLPTPQVTKRYWYSSEADRRMWRSLSGIVGAPWELTCGGSSPCGSAGPGLLATDINKYSAAVALDKDLDRATGIRSMLVAGFKWGPSQQQQSLGKCESNGFVGFVGSNALTYEGTAPKFVQESQELTYRVASPHYLPDGKPFYGVYELIVNRRVADCLWGYGSIKARALVQVVSENNQPKVHTSVTRQTPDFISLSVTGYTYSESKLKIKLENEIPAVAPIPSKKTIVCVTIKKPTKVKKVTALKPRCPKGYKPR